MVHELIGLLARNGPMLIFANVLAKQLGLPLPAFPTLIVAGALAADGKLSLMGVFLVSIAASLVGDLVWYVSGRLYGHRVMRLICRVSLSPDSCVRQTEVRFKRWGVGALAVSNFVPGLSIIAAPMAGAMRWPWPAFVAFDMLGAALWASTGLALGFLFHIDVEHLVALLQSIGARGALLIVAILATYIGHKWFERRRFYRLLRMARISVDELHEMMTSGLEPVVVDVRSPAAIEIDSRAVPGAVILDPENLDTQISALPTDRDIIVYCSCPNEATAAKIAKLLINRGYTRVRPLLGGLDAWAAAGHPIERRQESDAGASTRAAFS